MARSLYKLPYVHRSLWENSIQSRKYITYTEKLAEKKFPWTGHLASNLHFWKRNSLLNKRLANTTKTIGIYNGLGFVILHLKKKYFGYKLGEYSLSRRTPRHKGKQRQKKKKGLKLILF